MLTHHLDRQIQKLKETVLAMGGLVEKSIEESVQCLLERNPERTQKVFELERAINDYHKRVDKQCLDLLACQKPSAEDLRLIFSIIKINTDLERMGDQAVNIAQSARPHLANFHPRLVLDLPRLANEVRMMVKDSLDAFTHQDPALAQNVLILDDLIDNLKRKIVQHLIEVMKKDSLMVEAALDLILITRSLERLGDHSTNIAEDAIFVATGDDVRHSGLFSSMDH